MKTFIEWDTNKRLFRSSKTFVSLLVNKIAAIDTLLVVLLGFIVQRVYKYKGHPMTCLDGHRSDVEV